MNNPNKETTIIHRRVASPTYLGISECPQFLEFATLESAKRKNTIFIDRVIYSIEDRDSFIEQIRQLIFNNIVREGNRFLLQHTGIAQGSVLSSFLCSIFYAHLESTILFGNSEKSLQLPLNSSFLVPPSIPIFSQSNSPITPSPILGLASPIAKELSSPSPTPPKVTEQQNIEMGMSMRWVDDFLYVTNVEEAAVKFLETLEKGIPEYGCFANSEKTKINFSMNKKTPSTSKDEGILFS